jgi:hypothetical protein
MSHFFFKKVLAKKNIWIINKLKRQKEVTMAFTSKMIMTLAVLSSASMFADEAGDVEITTIATNPKAQAKPKMAAQMSNKQQAQAQTQAPATSRQEFLPNMVAPNNWRLTGGFVYFLPSVDDTTFLFLDESTSSEVAVGKAVSNDFGFAPGFRFGVEYALGHKYKQVQVFYTQLNSDQHKTVEGYGTALSTNSPGRDSRSLTYTGYAKSRVHQFYQSFDFSYAQRLMNCAVMNDAGLCFYLKPGLEYTRLNFVQQNQYGSQSSNETFTFKDKSKVWGVGPSIGLSMDYNVFKGALYTKGTHALAVNVLFSGAILASDQRASTSNTVNSVTYLNEHIQKTWRLIPAFHARAGLNYLMRGETYAFNLGVGYEFNSYNRAVYRQRINPSTGINISEYTNYDLQGLVVTGSFGF